jgi:hypothetical protein
MSERWFPAREPRLRSEQTYLIPATDLTSCRLKRSIVARSTPKRASPYPPNTKKKPAKMVTRSPPAKTVRPTLIDNDSDMPGGLQLALIGPADSSGGAAGGLPPTLPSPFPPVDPLQTVKTDPPGAGALDPAGGAKRKTGNGNGRNGNSNGQKTQEEIEKERAAREAELQKEQDRAERMRLREEKAEQERLARIKQKEADNKEAQRLEKERQERDYRTQEELVKRQLEKERLAREQQVAEEAAQGKLVSVESVVTRPPSTNVVSGVYTSNYFRPINKPPVTPCPTTDDEHLRPQSAPVASSAAKPVPTKFSNEWFERYELSSPITPFSRPKSRMQRNPYLKMRTISL